MARITVEDCLENVENRFELVMVASKRARQLQTGGKDPMVDEDNDKPSVLALREVAEGLVTASILNEVAQAEEVVDENLAALEAAAAAAAEVEEVMNAEVVPEDDPNAGAAEKEADDES